MEYLARQVRLDEIEVVAAGAQGLTLVESPPLSLAHAMFFAASSVQQPPAG